MECRVRMVALLVFVAVLAIQTTASPVASASHIKSPKARLLEKRNAGLKVQKVAVVDLERSKQDKFEVPDTKERVEQLESKSKLAQIHKSPISQKSLSKSKASHIRDSRHRKRSVPSAPKWPLRNRPKRSSEYVADGLVPVVGYPDYQRGSDDYYYADEANDDYDYIQEPLTEQELEDLALIASELQQFNDISEPRPYGEVIPLDDLDEAQLMDEIPDGYYPSNDGDEGLVYLRERRGRSLLPSMTYGSIYQGHYPKYRYGMYGKRAEPDYDVEEAYQGPVIVPVVIEEEDDDYPNFEDENTLDPALAERIRYLAEQL